MLTVGVDNLGRLLASGFGRIRHDRLVAVSGEYHENYDGLKHLGRLFGLLAALGRPLGLGVAVPSEGLAQRHFSSLHAGEKLRCQFSNAFRPVNVAGTWRANTPEVSTRAQHQTNRAAIAQRGPLARVCAFRR